MCVSSVLGTLVACRLHGGAVAQRAELTIDQRRAAGGEARRSLRFRCALLARYIDAAASRTSDATVFSVGCGRLCEAGMSRAVCGGELGRFVALDRDPRIIERVSASYGRFGVEPILGGVEELLERGAPGEFDLIYAGHLYKHLTEAMARRLTATLFRAVRPGGTLLVVDCARGHAEQDQTGVFPDCTLLCRIAEEITGLASNIPSAAIGDSKLFADPSGNVLYLELVRCAASAG
jgi:SAM-dependent methyltransferase